YGTDLWTAMPVSPEAYPRNRRQFQVLARVADGATLETVNTELEGIARRVEAAWAAEFEEYAGWRAEARTWTDVNVATLRPAALILLGAVGFLLLLVCANVANMLLARASGRRREMAVRTAMGAGRGRLLRQLLTESVVLAGAGGLAGLGLAVLGVRAVRAFVDTVGVPVPGEVTMDATVLAFTAAVSVGAGLLFGLAPALHAAGARLQGILQAEARGVTGSASRQRLQRSLVAVEVALALGLLAGGGLLVRSLGALIAVDPGWETDRVLTMRLTLPPERYGPEEIRAFFPLLAERVEGLPGVRSAAAATQFPGRVFSRSEFRIGGSVPDDDATLPTAFTTVVTPGFFETLGVRVVRGRVPASDLPPDAALVGVMNQAAARAYFPGEDPVGRRIRLGGAGEERPWVEIVGVVADTRNRGLDQDPAPELYAAQQQVGGGNQLFLLVRTEGDPRGVLTGVREVVREMDPDQPVYAIQTGEEVYADQAAPRRATTLFVAGFAAFALLLAAVGIYAVVSYSVQGRTREIGVRMALGARAGRVRRLVVAQALVPVGLGVVAGLLLAFVLGQQLEAVLFQVDGADPATMAGVTSMLVVVAAAASWIPARRASRLDPAETLRTD
ncbi:MAG TPA: ADOP family duplicated permease, partial [Longimicrobiales bacterium]|nr:ADOP family duplicated permease [Longimicrobiales bacterium]